MKIYRFADERQPIWDGTGAALIGGRWNSPGNPVIYCSLSYACAMLEILAHANIGHIPLTHRLVLAEVPDSVSLERYESSELPFGWDTSHIAIARALGNRWLQEKRSAVLLVPSIVAKLDWNALVNPNHPDAAQLVVTAPEQVLWDKRLFNTSGDNGM